jgi:cell division septation protein DedD
MVLVAGSGTAAWYFLKKKPTMTVQQTSGAEPPTIKADNRPYKAKPQDPGGMEVPNQDKMIYDRLGGQQGGQQPERLLPPPEPPMQPPAQQQAAKAPPPLTLEPPQPPAAPRQMVTPEPPPALPPVASASPKAVDPPAANKPLLPPPAASPPPTESKPALVAGRTPAPAPPAKPATVKATPSGSWQVQLGALRSQADAEGEWKKLQKANTDLLSGLSPEVIRADLGDKGVFWRLRAGPFADPDAAKTLCTAMEARKNRCAVVRK